MSDTSRKTCRELSYRERSRTARVKELAEEMADILTSPPSGQVDGRCISISLTKLEECVMWGVKGLS